MLKQFFQYYRPHLALFVADTVCALVMAAVDLAFPVILRSLSNGLYLEGSAAILATLPLLFVGLVALYAVRYVCRYFVSGWGHIMGARIESAMREDLFAQYQRFSFRYYDKHNTGDLMSRLVSDLFDIAEAAHHGPESILVCAVELIGSFVIMFWISPVLAAAMLVIGACLVVYNIFANRRLQDVFMDNRVKISGVNSALEDSLAGVRVVKSFGNEREEKRKFARANNAYLDAKTRMYKAMGWYQASSSVMTAAMYIVILVLGGYLVAVGNLTAVDMATFALYVSLFTTPIETLINFTEMFQKAFAGFKRLREILDTVPDVVDAPGAKPLVAGPGAVRYEHVYFSYDGSLGAALTKKPGEAARADDAAALEAAAEAAAVEGEPAVLKDLDLTMEAGKTYALVGPSGAGKSTTCALLPRFYDVDAGRILIDGQDISQVTVASVREAVGLVQQDVYLFDGTIGENIAYGRPNATFDEVIEAAKLANIHDFICTLPDGYNTRVGERGSRLSGGQKQRVAIARVFLKDPRILVLDEATSALDNESEAAVQESLRRLSQGRTTIIIAHRLSTIRDADVIVTMEDGRVSELGTHDELLAKGGTYARYYTMQFGAHEAHGEAAATAAAATCA
jgi:ATP-binding cassette subfamily B protein